MKSLEIRPTQYGSIATGYSNWMEDTGNIIIYVRMDADVSHIAEAIILDRFRKFDSGKQYTWEEREAIIDFLLTESQISTLFTNYNPTLEAIRQKQNAHLAKESKEYLQSYGFTFEKIFDIDSGNIYMQKKLITFTEYESLALKLLIEKRRSPVSYDELADAIWGVDADEKFSIAAITKLIERLRKTIESNGVFPSIIQTCKGYGYMLVD